MNTNLAYGFTETELDIAKHTDLLGLLPSLGYTLKQIGSYYTTAEMDSIRIRDPTRWKRYSTRQSGDAITFLQAFCGMRFPEAVDYLLAYHGRRRRKVRSAPFPPSGENSARSLAPPLPIGPASLGSDGSPDSPDRNKPIPRPKPPPPREKPPFVLPPANPDQRRVFAYLRKRCVSTQVIRTFMDPGLLYEDAQYHNCVFVGRDGSGQPKFASKRGTSSEEIPLRFVPTLRGEDSTRSIPSSSPHRNRCAGLRRGPQNSFNETQGRELRTPQLRDNTETMDAALTALLNFAPVQVLADENLPAGAYYDPRKMTLAINPNCSDSQAFAAIAAEIAQARFHDRGRNPAYSREGCELSAQSVSYILCQRFGIQRELPDLTGMANRCRGWATEDRLAFLKEIQSMSRQIGGSIEKTIAPPQRAASARSGAER